MSTTIDSLSIEIVSNIGQADVKIDALAKSLGRLKENSNLTKVTNNLGKLSTQLATLKSSVAGLEVSKLRALGTEMGNLAGIQKLSGLNSAVNTLKKLPDIMNNLNDAVLDKFSTQMRKLANALGPLATQITKVANGFNSLPSKITGAVSATNKMASATRNVGESMKASQLDIFAFISNMETVIQYAGAVIDVFRRVISEAIGWDGIQYRFGRTFGEDAEEVYQHILKINKVMGINTQEFMQYSSMYGALLSGFGMDQDKVTTISVGLSELTYDLWAANNDVVKRYEDVATAVKSAITGEIEPIRNLGIALTEASLQEFIDSTNLAGLSIEKMTEAQKSEVRYAAMVNAAMNQGIVGTYAREMQTAEGAVRSLSQSFKTLVQALGSLFIPLLQMVVPYVTAFVEVVTDAVHWFADLVGVELFKIDWSSANTGVGGLADGAENAAAGLGGAAKQAKKLQSYTMGFDELNVIDPNKGSGSSGKGIDPSVWGTGLDLDTLWDDKVFEQASSKVAELKEKIKSFFDEWKWGFAAAGVALGVFATVKHWSTIVSVATKIWSVLNFLPNTIRAVIGAAKGAQTIFDMLKGGNAASSALTFMFPKLTQFVTTISGAAKAVGVFVSGISAPVWATIAAVIAAIASVAYFLYENWDKVAKVAKEFFAENIAPKLAEIKGHFDKILETLGPVGEAIKGLWSKIKEFVSGLDFSGVAKAFEVIGGVIFGVISGVIAGAIDWLLNVVEGAVQYFSGVVQIVKGIIDLIVAIFTKGDVGAAWDKIWNGVVDVAKGLWGMLTAPIRAIYDGVVKWFTKLWDELVGHSIVPDTVNAIVDWFLKLPKKILGPIKDFAEAVKERFVTMWANIKSWYNTNVAPKFTKQYWLDTFSNLKEGFTQTIKNAINSGIDMMNRFIGWLNGALSFSWDGLTIAGKTIYEGGSIQLFTIPSIPRLENGGVLEDGLFTMNRGEIAGKFTNGRSVVANNEMIVDGIAEGVYRAVVAAMGDSNRSQDQNVNVYLDGKQIYASVKKTEAQRGKTLMGNQLGYSY